MGRGLRNVVCNVNILSSNISIMQDLPSQNTFTLMTGCPNSLPVILCSLYTLSISKLLLADVIAFVPERDDEAGRSVLAGNYAVERRSYFGLFIRRCYLSFFKLSWRGSIKLLADYKNWVEGKDAGYNLRPTDRDGGLLLVPTISDEQNQAQMDPYERYRIFIR